MQDSQITPSVEGASSRAAHGSALTLTDFFACLSTTRSAVVAVAFRSKSGRCSSDDHRLISRCWSKLKTKKWAHLYDDEYFAVVAVGAREAVKAVNPLLDAAPNVRICDDGQAARSTGD